MTAPLDHTAIERWRADPSSFIETVLYDPETEQPFQLLDSERNFLKFAFRLTATGKLLFPEQVYACPKKSGKTGFGGMHMLATILLFGNAFAEGYALANDLEQASSRVFLAIRRIVEASPLLRREAKITQDKIVFPDFRNATITAITSDYASAAGANPTISCFDEAWAYTSERARRLFDEMIPPPTRKVACRLTVTYAGFENEIHLAARTVQARLAAATGWSRSLRWRRHPHVLVAYAGGTVAGRGLDCRDAAQSYDQINIFRMIENRFVTSRVSRSSTWPPGTNASSQALGPLAPGRFVPLYIGVDASKT